MNRRNFINSLVRTGLIVVTVGASAYSILKNKDADPSNCAELANCNNCGKRTTCSLPKMKQNERR
ncbi:hypothetical protein OAO55_03290 [Bacteroidales bacterium]|nr:hypothetical protein [Bacteroidales bacterium]